jgi:sporulation protein YlmC with PRC-barrel domain
MRLLTLSILGLFILSFAFVSGKSFSQDWQEGPVTSYTHRMARDWDITAASGMLGSELKSTDGLPRGQISDLVIDPADGRITSVIISNFPGRGAEDLFLPFGSIMKSGGATFVFNSPEYTYGYYGYYGYEPYRSDGYYLVAQSMPREGYRASRLIGGTVWTREEEEVARIHDLAIDHTNGRVVCLVVSDFEGMGGKTVAVPFGALSEPKSFGENIFVLNTSKETVLDAPAFTWPQADDREFAGDIYRHYGFQPYWEME